MLYWCKIIASRFEALTDIDRAPGGSALEGGLVVALASKKYPLALSAIPRRWRGGFHHSLQDALH